MANIIDVRLEAVDGCVTNIQVEPGTTAAEILDHEAYELPAGFCARLVTHGAEVVAPETQIWEPQADF